MFCQIYEYNTSTHTGWHPTLLPFFLFSFFLPFFHYLLKSIYFSLIHTPHLFLFSPSLKHCNSSIFDDYWFTSSVYFVCYRQISEVHSYEQTQWWSRINYIGEWLFGKTFSKGRERITKGGRTRIFDIQVFRKAPHDFSCLLERVERGECMRCSERYLASENETQASQQQAGNLKWEGARINLLF